MQEIMLPAARVDDDEDGEETPSGDRGMNVLVPQYVVADHGAKVV